MHENNIKLKTLKSVIWKFSERFLAQFVATIVSIILARILSPEDYSIVSVTAIFFAFANVFIFGGFNSALIQKKDADVDDYSSVLHFSIAISIIIYFLIFVGAPLFATWFHNDDLVLFLRIMGLTLPILAYKSIICAYISSHLQFKMFFWSTLGGTIASAFVGIYMALKGCGAIALMAQQMTNAIIDTVILAITTKMPIVFKISISKLKVLIQYGWKIFATSLISKVYVYLSPIVVGTKYPKADLSYYTKGQHYPELISQNTNYTLSAVLFPVLSKYQDNKELLLKYTRRFIRTSSYVLFPLMCGLFSVSNRFVFVVLTEKWMPAVPFIRIFCIAYMFEMIHAGNCETIKAMGRSDIFLKMEIIKKSLYFLVIILFIIFSKTPVELAFSSIICTMIAIIVNCIPNIKLLGYGIKKQLSDILPNLINAVIMACVVLLFDIGLPNNITVLCLQVATGVLVYLLLGIITRNSDLKYVVHTLKQLLNKE